LLATRGASEPIEPLTGDGVVNIPGWPYVVWSDTEDMVALYLPEGAKLWR